MRFRGRGILIAAVIGLIIVAVNRKALVLSGENDFVLQPVGPSGFELQSALHLYNPNFLSSTVETIHEKIYLNNHLISVVNMAIEQGIPGRKNTDFPISVRFDKNAFQEAFPEEGILENNPVQVRVTGYLTYQNFTGGDTLAIQLTDTAMLNLIRP